MGERILLALEEEGRTQTSVERQIWPSQGQLSRLVYGERGTSTIDADKMRALADVLHVQFEWLVLGRGPMRRDGREAPTPAEEAMRLARLSGCREDAIQETWERLQGSAKGMTAMDWALAFDASARVLERAGVPRPELVQDKQRAIARTKQLEKATEAKKKIPAPAPSQPATRRRATSA